jgi:hypothetical protein
VQVLEVTEGAALKPYNAATALHRVARHAAADSHVKNITRHDERFLRLLGAVRTSLSALQPRVRVHAASPSFGCAPRLAESVWESLWMCMEWLRTMAVFGRQGKPSAQRFHELCGLGCRGWRT